MRFHVVSLPHSQTTRAFSACAFGEKVRKFCMMMKARGHTVYLYAGEQNEAPCDELITCISEKERLASLGGKHFTQASFDSSLPHWRKFNANVIAGITARAQPQDFICLIGGVAHKPIADALPHLTTVEFGIGYPGTFAKYRVWESYAWMHTCYGSANPNAASANGQWFDAVIPSYFDPAEFPFRAKSDDYFLFVGRLIERKGLDVAVETCKRLGARLIVAGPGEPPDGVEYAGVVGPEERGRLMAGAKALFAPTIYVEPFGSVAMEAHACGTPVISTDWGAFTETVQQGVTGFRCRSLQEFVDAAKSVDTLDRTAIRDRAHALWSLDVVGEQYERYFERLLTLWGGGWYALKTNSAV